MSKRGFLPQKSIDISPFLIVAIYMYWWHFTKKLLTGVLDNHWMMTSPWDSTSKCQSSMPITRHNLFKNNLSFETEKKRSVIFQFSSIIMSQVSANNIDQISRLWVLCCMIMSNWVIAYKITTWYHVAFHVNFMQKVFWKKKMLYNHPIFINFPVHKSAFFQITHYKNLVLQDGFILTH